MTPRGGTHPPRRRANAAAVRVAAKAAALAARGLRHQGPLVIGIGVWMDEATRTAAVAIAEPARGEDYGQEAGAAEGDALPTRPVVVDALALAGDTPSGADGAQ